MDAPRGLNIKNFLKSSLLKILMYCKLSGISLWPLTGGIILCILVWCNISCM